VTLRRWLQRLRARASWFLVFGAVGCGASQAQREACYAAREAHATERAFAECRETGWEACPAKAGIQAELRRGEAACP
jgi:hypothetical protein